MVSTCLEKIWAGEEKVILFFKFTLRVGKCTRYWYTRKNFYCRFSYVGTWELVHLLLGTKNFSYHIFCENIDRKHNKISTLKSRDIHSQETYHWQIEPSNTLVKNNVLNEIKKGNIDSRFQGLQESQRESISKFRWPSKLADKVNWNC